MTATAFILLGLLFVKHFVADFVLQTEQMVREKGHYGEQGGIDHASIHAFLTLLVLFFTLPLNSIFLVVALVDGIVHYHIDWAKMNLSRGLTPKDNKFWMWIGVDQLLHYMTYLGIVYVTVS